jgi:hypothetical protein
MPERTADTTGTHQIETAVRRLDSLSILPGVAAQLLSKLIQSQSSTSALADIIESEPALTAKIFHLLHQEGVSISGERVSVRQLLGKLPTDTLRNALFSVKATEKPNWFVARYWKTCTCRGNAEKSCPYFRKGKITKQQYLYFRAKAAWR